jgi:hypothetical protein
LDSKSVNGNRGVEGEDQTEKPKEQAELNTGAMPMMKPKLPAALITMVADWIRAGALDN